MPPEVKQGKSGKWFEKTPDGWVETDAPASSSEGPGVLRSIARGIAQAPAMLPQSKYMALAGMPMRTSPQAAQAAVDRQPDAAAQRFAGMTGIAPPTNYVERTAERFGQGLPFAAAASPYLYGLGGAKAVGLGVAGDALGALSEQGAADRGYGPLVQLAAGIPAAVLTPSGIADDVVRAGSSATRFGRRIAAAGSAPPLSADDTAKLAWIAKDFGTTEKNVLNAVGEWQRRMPHDPNGGRAFLDQAVEALQEARVLFPDPKKRPTVAQILGELGGANIGAMESALARDAADGVDMSAEIAGRKLAVVQDLESQWDNMVPGAPAKNAQTSIRELRQKMQGEAQALWEAVPFNEMPRASMKGLAGANKRLNSVPLADQSFLPTAEMEIVDNLVKKYGRKVPMAEIQSLRSRLYAIHDAAKSPFAPMELKQQSRLAGKLTHEVEAIVKGLPEAGSAAYMRARKATSDMYDLLPRDSDALRVIEEIDDPVKMVRRVLATPKDARTVRKAFEQTPEGLQSLQHAAWEDLFGDGMQDFSAKAIRRKLFRQRGAYAEIFGPEKLQATFDLLRKIDIAGRFITGTPAQFRSTGSNMTPLHIMLAGAEVATSPGAASAQIVGKIAKRVFESAQTEKARNAIFREALMDDERAETLTKIPTARELPAWQKNWDKLVARSKARAAQRGAATAGRAMGPETEPSQ